MTDTPPLHLLLVDDEAAFREVIAERLTEHGFKVKQAGTGEDALERLSEFAFDILVTDLRLPGVDGRRVLDESFARYPDIIAIVISGYGTLKEAVEVTRLGAEGFITKPFPFEELLHELNVTLEKRRLRAENAYLRAQLQDKFKIEGMIGRTPIMERLSELLRTVAATTSTVLVTGETGTGKELAARAIHDGSARRSQRFVAMNCSAIPESLLEAELFGHVRGAFTGAVANRQGRVEQANRGTLFLDEVGTMTAALQSKLLRVLQSREFERVGDSQTVRVDVRIIAATNSDLKRMVADGTFREDSVLSIERHSRARARAARARRRHPAARTAFSRSAREGNADARARDALAGRAAGAHGVRLARQRPPARERRRACVRVVAGANAADDRGPAGRDSRLPADRAARRGVHPG